MNPKDLDEKIETVYYDRALKEYEMCEVQLYLNKKYSIHSWFTVLLLQIKLWYLRWRNI